MKLVNRVVRLEGAVSGRAQRAAVGLVWDGDYEALAEGEDVGAALAVDLTLDWSIGGVVEVAGRERVSAGAGDRGVVRGADGAEIGVVCGIVGDVISIEYTAPGLPPELPANARRLGRRASG